MTKTNENSLSSFAQLYELSPEKERKEFLDDLFSFMQKQGKWSSSWDF